MCQINIVALFTPLRDSVVYIYVLVFYKFDNIKGSECMFSPVFNPLSNPYALARHTHYASKGMVATSQPLAAQAGLEILKKGGNAIDAAIATAACLTVVEPTSNGIGGDAFAIVWVDGKMHGLNSSGKSPQSISIEKVRALGYTEMPKMGMVPITVPGAPGAWASLSQKFGHLPLIETLAPAINYAQNGYPISPVLGKNWERAYNAYKSRCTGEEFAHWFKTFAPMGRAPKVGEIWQSPAHASTLKEIASSDSFYTGALAKQISDFCAKHGGFLATDDLAAFEPEWVNPVSVDYRGYKVWEIPPNGQGIVALIALNIMKGFDFLPNDMYDVETFHKQFEAMKLAFACGKKYITDSNFMDVPVEELLSDKFANELRTKITDLAQEPVAYLPPKSGTVYLATADEDGNMVSYIQSNYMGFGSGIVIPDTGIAMQNRGADFSLDPTHANALMPGKRTYHTIIPGFLTKGDTAVGPFGVMGGYMQPQGHLQVVMNAIDFGLNPQMALDAPRWQWMKGKVFEVESHFPKHIAEELVRRGHAINICMDAGSFGRGQIIWRDSDSGVLAGGTESRTDGAVAVW